MLVLLVFEVLDSSASVLRWCLERDLRCDGEEESDEEEEEEEDDDDEDERDDEQDELEDDDEEEEDEEEDEEDEEDEEEEEDEADDDECSDSAFSCTRTFSTVSGTVLLFRTFLFFLATCLLFLFPSSTAATTAGAG